MGIKKVKPVTPGRRHATYLDNAELTTDKPCKALLVPAKKHSGRNNQGKVTARHRGGGVKRMYRVIDFQRSKDGIRGTVASIEYDPNRSANIALIEYEDKEKRYIIAPQELFVGMSVMSGDTAGIKVGNATTLERIPVGTLVHNIELSPGKGGQLVRSAGLSAQIVGKEKGYAIIKIPSGELRLIHLQCRATIGEIGNEDYSNISLGKAGRSRYLGRRPKVRGTAMSPEDHPHGGGEGRSPAGMNPKTKWGKLAYGVKTRTNKRTTRFILRSRKNKRA